MMVCAHCGASMEGKRAHAIYCSRTCKSNERRKRAATLLAVKTRACVVCGVEFTLVKCSKYCTPRCRAAAVRRRAGVLARDLSQRRPCLACNRPTTRGNFCSAKCRAGYEIPIRPCGNCGTDFTPKTLADRYCSIKCRGRHSHSITPFVWSAGAQACYQRRRALIKGATVGERIVPADVYDRDGWVCGLCGDPVDRSLQYPDPMSKSLDHIVPVSRGGAHALTNVQCSHLHCNISKSDRLIAA